jgi:hypothetical protein
MTAAIGLLLAALLRTQEPAAADPPAEQKKQIDLDFSDQYKALSEDLERSLRWKKLFGIFGVAEVHVFPGRESGPYLGPPLTLWGHGFGASLWRDPVTGWPIQ